FPQGRGDTTFQYNDTVAWIHGRHAFKFGGEFRRFRNNNLNLGTGGLIAFASVTTFLAGTPSSPPESPATPVTPALRVSAFDAFAQDDVKLTSHLTLNLGVRWEVNRVPTEIHDRLGIYDFTQNKIIQEGNGREAYNQRYTNIGPRVGLAWDPTGR